MSNKVKAMSHSIIDVGGKIGLGGVSGRYKGTASTLLFLSQPIRLQKALVSR